MAGSVNKVVLVGRLGKDPEARNFPSGGKVVTFSIATSETWRDKQSGERKERTEWHSVAIFNEALGKIAEQYLRKGSLVYLEGKLETRKWQDQAGNDRYTTEVVLRPYAGELTMLENRRDDQGGGDYGGSYDDRSQGGGYGGNQGGGYGGNQGRDPARQAPAGHSSGGHGSYRDSMGRPINNRQQDLDDEIPF